MLCSIQKGIVKRQLPFSLVKSCDDGDGSRFSISFKDHHDYELEATSLEDKHKVSLCVLLSEQMFSVAPQTRLILLSADHPARQSDNLREHIQRPSGGQHRHRRGASGKSPGRPAVTPPRRPGVLQMGEVRVSESETETFTITTGAWWVMWNSPFPPTDMRSASTRAS